VYSLRRYGWSSKEYPLDLIRMHDNAISGCKAARRYWNDYVACMDCIDPDTVRKDFPQGHRFAQWFRFKPEGVAKWPLQR